MDENWNLFCESLILCASIILYWRIQISYLTTLSTSVFSIRNAIWNVFNLIQSYFFLVTFLTHIQTVNPCNKTTENTYFYIRQHTLHCNSQLLINQKSQTTVYNSITTWQESYLRWRQMQSVNSEFWMDLQATAVYAPHPLSHFSTTPARTVWVRWVRPKEPRVIRSCVVDRLQYQSWLLHGKPQWNINFSQHSSIVRHGNHPSQLHNSNINEITTTHSISYHLSEAGKLICIVLTRDVRKAVILFGFSF